MNVHLQQQLNRLINRLTDRRVQLGMSEYHIAWRSGVSQPTIHRILSGENPQASLANVLAIADALGLAIEVSPHMSVEEYRDWQADRKAGQIGAMTQATSALEGQGLDKETRKAIKERLKQKLLAGSPSALWSE